MLLSIAFLWKKGVTAEYLVYPYNNGYTATGLCGSVTTWLTLSLTLCIGDYVARGHYYRGIASKWPGILQLISQKKDYAFLVTQEQKYGPLGGVRARPWTFSVSEVVCALA